MKRILTLLVVLTISIQSFSQTSTPMRRPLWVGLDMGGTWQSSDMKAVGGIGWSFTLSRYSRLDAPGILWWGWRFRYMDGNNFGYNYHPLFGIENDPSLNGTQNPLVNYSAGQQPNGEKYIFSNYKFHFDEFAYELMIGSQGLRRHGVLLYAFGGAGLTHYKVKTNQLDELNNMYDYSDVPQTGVDADVKDVLRSKWDFTYETVKTAGKWGFMPSAGFGMGYQWGNGVALGVEHRTTWALNDNIDGVNYSTEGTGTRNGNDLYNYDGLFVRWTFGGNGNSRSTNDNPPPPPNPNTYTQNPNNNPNTNPNNNQTTNPYPNNNPNGPSNISTYPPTVNFTTPSSNPYTTNVQTQQLVVNVTHIQYSSQISLMINNQYSNNFSFNPNTNTMVFTTTLNPGNNYFVVNASNQYGSASDNQTIIYNQVVANNTNTGLPPQVTINNPAADPYNSSTQTYNVTATVLNVASTQNIQVLGNSAAINNFSYNAATHQVSFLASLNTGANLYEVIGTNNYGSASDAVTINYNPVAAIAPPVVTITSPNVCPYTTKTGTATITANITNITSANQVSIIFNSQAVTMFSFVPNTSFATVSFVATLNPGSNPFSISGTNTAGTDTKSCEIIFKNQSAPATPPTVTITNPPTSPYNSTSQSMVLTATVLNVASQAEITVNYNNANTANFQYDMNTHVLTYNAL
ncbi:MAG TPA: hypothetical protein VL651_01510, partial [Bacteroidia bacterium]|nr:hypothetical protein [Bacteroidia bacterium]